MSLAYFSCKETSLALVVIKTVKTSVPEANDRISLAHITSNIMLHCGDEKVYNGNKKKYNLIIRHERECIKLF